jgi:hypothetical protein
MIVKMGAFYKADGLSYLLPVWVICYLTIGSNPPYPPEFTLVESIPGNKNPDNQRAWVKLSTAFKKKHDL